MTIPIWDKFGHKSGRLFQDDLSQQRWRHTRHSPEQETSDRAAPPEAKAREPPTKNFSSNLEANCVRVAINKDQLNVQGQMNEIA